MGTNAYSGSGPASYVWIFRILRSCSSPSSQVSCKATRKHGDTQDEVIELLESDDPDLAEIINDIKVRIVERPYPRMKYLDYIVEFYSIFDERQKKIFIKDLKKEIEKRHLWV